MLPETFSHLTIRSGNNTDREIVMKLVSDVLSEYGLNIDPNTTDADLNDIEANYLNRGGLFEIIEDREGRLLGSVGIYPLDSETCELRKMYFVPSVRGLGLGRYILRRIIERAKELRFKRIVLETSSRLEAANRLYARFGFQPVNSDHLASRADRAYALDL
jgi:putative acetyltransferase